MRRLFAAVVALACAYCTTYEDADAVGPRDGGPDAPSFTRDGGGLPGKEKDAATTIAVPQDMVRVGETFAIDRTEVTVGAWQRFKATHTFDRAAAPDRCAAKKAYGPPATCNGAATDPSYPQTCLDWCDAYMYCALNEKRLCGSINAKTPLSSYSETLNKHLDQWTAACVGDQGESASVYPYGPSADAGACNIASDDSVPDTPDPKLVPADSSATCTTSSGVLHLSGNAVEFEDYCETRTSDAGSSVYCYARGGSIHHSVEKSRCDSVVNLILGYASDDTGFRCCKDLQ